MIHNSACSATPCRKIHLKVSRKSGTINWVFVKWSNGQATPIEDKELIADTPLAFTLDWKKSINAIFLFPGLIRDEII